MKKKIPKTMEELTKDYEEIAKKNGYGAVTKEQFEKNLNNLVKKKNSKDNQK